MKKILFILILLTSIIITDVAFARIDILPKKVVINPRERGGEFSILNLYDKPGNFRVEINSFKQDENGKYQKMNAPLSPAFTPEKMIKFSPRQFTIEPGGRQKVRFSVIKPASLPDGEYRFHVKAIRFADNEILESNTKAVSMIMNVGVTIPVIIRHGNAYSDAKINDGTLAFSDKKNEPELNLSISREGNASTIGKLDVFWRPESGKEKQIGMVSNANIFTEINQRNFKVSLKEIPKGNGYLLVRYSDEIQSGKIFDEFKIQN